MPAAVIDTTGEAVEVTPARKAVGMLTLDRFPVAESGHPRFAQRFDAGPGGHKGTDIFAPTGTPVLAVRDGKVVASVEPKGGNVVYLTAGDGSRYFYGHLDSWKRSDPYKAPEVPLPVKAGDEIGYVGTTGNAAGREPHLHFQMADRAGGEPVDPYPFLSSVAPRGATGPAQQGISINAKGLLIMFGLYWLFKKRRRA